MTAARVTAGRALAVAAGWALVAIIIVLSLGPAPSAGPQFENSDKLGHALAYATLMAWFCLLYEKPVTRWRYLAGFFLLGLTLEVIQGLLPLRQASAMDGLANLTGLLAGLFALTLVSRLRAA